MSVGNRDKRNKRLEERWNYQVRSKRRLKTSPLKKIFKRRPKECSNWNMKGYVCTFEPGAANLGTRTKQGEKIVWKQEGIERIVVLGNVGLT